jgi:antitoxin CptB
MTEPAPPPPPGQPIDIRRRRLIFRATHRGSHENDLLLGGYVLRHIEDMTASEMDALEEVMELPDADLADWLTGRRPIPPAVDSPLLRAIRAFALEKRS